MADFLFTNNFITTLAAAVSNTATTINVAGVSTLPSNVPQGEVFVVTLNDAATRSVFEILYVTAISGTTLTVERGQENTQTQNWLIGDYAFSGVTAGQMQAVQDTGIVNAENIFTINGQVSLNAYNINNNTGNINANTAQIATNKLNISNNTTAIQNNSSAIANLNNAVSKNTTDIAANTSGVESNLNKINVINQNLNTVVNELDEKANISEPTFTGPVVVEGAFTASGNIMQGSNYAILTQNANRKIQAFQIYNVQANNNYNFPEAFSGTPYSITLTDANDDNGVFPAKTPQNSWTNSSFQVFTWEGTNGRTYSVVAVGPA